MLGKLYIKLLVILGKAVDIWSKKPYPANVLSNLYNNNFFFDGVQCGSMEGFLQSLKYQAKSEQLQICQMEGKSAKKMSTTNWQANQIVWWKGNPIERQSYQFLELVKSAYVEMFKQNERFRTALMSTRGKKLYHCRGEHNPYKTILTEQEFCGILIELRNSYDRI